MSGPHSSPDPEVDLHVHTTASDGALEIEEVPSAARDAGVQTVAVTDHDRIHPGLDAPVSVHEGVQIIRGVELRVDAGDQRVDLLGYGVRETGDLRVELARLQRNRIERARAIVDCVEDETGVDLGLEPAEGVGRPHIAHAVAASEAPYDYQGAFDSLIGGDGPCYVPREITGFERGVGLLRDACAVVSLAHPFRYPDVEAALSLTTELDAVERYYPYGRAVDEGRIERHAHENGLLRTGGSDAHDRTLGRAGLAGEEAEAFLARL